MQMIFTGRALRRMFERDIEPDHVSELLTVGEVIENYPEDLPHPSRLLFAIVGGRPLHAVAARAPNGDEIVVTVYIPSSELWEPGWRRRKAK